MVADGWMRFKLSAIKPIGAIFRSRSLARRHRCLPVPRDGRTSIPRTSRPARQGTSPMLASAVPAAVESTPTSVHLGHRIEVRLERLGLPDEVGAHAGAIWIRPHSRTGRRRSVDRQRHGAKSTRCAEEHLGQSRSRGRRPGEDRPGRSARPPRSLPRQRLGPGPGSSGHQA